ncbi:four helix bundle protein [Gillisia sp. Hel_I_86]|uniref:four helix bundle protein n=1 Tax=Gillisia sp. Hel_I_86 TaxID=1249981 RepID=UPI0011999B3E|nr:four helix bundle protein [Gillisia sp. Hel_I_86]TVZ25843.1 four helix bundle protein [Gillisia sp. Hel_I_86]
MRNFLNLEIWKRSHKLTLKIYKTTNSFPKEELFGLTSQMRRSSSSIPTNIAEGSGRSTNQQFAYFLQIASGSCSEIQYQLILSKDLSYISEELFNELHRETIEIRKMIFHYTSKL